LGHESRDDSLFPLSNLPKAKVAMSNYTYEAVDAGGLKIEGSLEVLDQSEAVKRVKEMGLFPVRIVEARDRRGSRVVRARIRGRAKSAKPGWGSLTINIPYFSGRVKASALAVFTRQLATLIEAGMPLLRGLRILREQEESAALQKILDELSERIEGGGSLSEALAAHPRVFNRLYINMVKAGELSGALEVTLRRLADFMEKAQKIKGKVKAAMFYPTAVMLVAAVILGIMLVYVIPKFRELFEGMSMKMPPFTTFVLNLSEAVRSHFLVVAGAGAAACVALRLFVRTPRGREILDRVKLTAPVFGPVFKKLAISRFARTFGTLMANGVPILQALEIVKETSGNVVIGTVISSVHESVKQGDSIAAPLRASGVFPAMVAGMVDIGEQTGALPDMMIKVADNYDDQVDNAVTSMTSLLEPILLVILAVIVGSIVIAVFLPIIKAETDGIGGPGSE
jgi:type IV pilus assembly protein PilC